MTKILSFFIFFFFLFVNLLPVFAQGTPPQMQPGNAQINLGNKQPAGMGIKAFENPNANVGSILSNAVLIMFIIGGLAVLVFFIWGAFDWVTSGGDKEKIAKSRAKIMNAFIGLALLALAAFIITLFGQIVGFNPLKTPPLPKLDDTPAPFPS